MSNFHIAGDDPNPLKNDLPDSRLRACNRSTICGPAGIMARVYCANCGCNGGLVTEDWAKSILYLCDDCYQKHGHLPMLQVPDEVVRGQVELPQEMTPQERMFDLIPQL